MRPYEAIEYGLYVSAKFVETPQTHRFVVDDKNISSLRCAYNRVASMLGLGNKGCGLPENHPIHGRR